jgi:hypothetical protein
MARRWSWQCKARGCNAELAIVDDGELIPRPGLPLRVARDGSVHITCTSLSPTGRICGRERSWTVGGRRSPDPPITAILVAG